MTRRPPRLRRTPRRPAPLAALLAAALAGCAAAPPAAPERPAFYDSLAASGARADPKSAQAVINGYRRNQGLAPLALDERLMRAARAQADAMAARDQLSHDVLGSLPSRLAAAGLPSVTAAENVSAGYHTVSDAFSGWRGSPPHDANLRMAGATRMGIATAYRPGSRYKVYWALIVAGG